MWCQIESQKLISSKLWERAQVKKSLLRIIGQSETTHLRKEYWALAQVRAPDQEAEVQQGDTKSTKWWNRNLRQCLTRSNQISRSISVPWILKRLTWQLSRSHQVRKRTLKLNYWAKITLSNKILKAEGVSNMTKWLDFIRTCWNSSRIQ